jgi:hypothetical protein
MVAALSLELEAVRAVQADAVEMALAAAAKAENWELTVPISEILVFTTSALASSNLSGRFSTATNWVKMLATSSPLPIPVDEMLAMDRS